ncbi:FG-GAP-like repeat-containing protein [Streptomyces zhihengii]
MNSPVPVPPAPLRGRVHLGDPRPARRRHRPGAEGHGRLHRDPARGPARPRRQQHPGGAPPRPRGRAAPCGHAARDRGRQPLPRGRLDRRRRLAGVRPDGVRRGRGRHAGGRCDRPGPERGAVALRGHRHRYEAVPGPDEGRRRLGDLRPARGRQRPHGRRQGRCRGHRHVRRAVALQRYRRRRGPFAARKRIGGGWGIYNRITAVGNLAGAAAGDLVARDASGVLWLHLGKGDGTFAARTRIGAGWNTYGDLVGVGDANGDGRPDLLALKHGEHTGSGSYFYAGTGDRLAPFRAAKANDVLRGDSGYESGF